MGGGSVSLLKTDDFGQVRTFTAHNNVLISDVQISHDNEEIAALDNKGRVIIWRIYDGQIIHTTDKICGARHIAFEQWKSY